MTRLLLSNNRNKVVAITLPAGNDKNHLPPSSSCCHQEFQITNLLKPHFQLDRGKLQGLVGQGNGRTQLWISPRGAEMKGFLLGFKPARSSVRHRHSPHAFLVVIKEDTTSSDLY